MREKCDFTDELEQLLKSGKIKGFMRIYVLRTKDDQIRVFPEVHNIEKDIALTVCQLALSSLYEQDETVQ